MEEETIIPSAPILVESTRSVGYSFEAAIADIIDNSIGAGANRVDVNFAVKPNEWLYILDNGCGMLKRELINAMRYGSQSPQTERDPRDLGRFGLGMKMASLSQCRRLTVVSKKSHRVNGASWDLDYIAQKNNWALQVLSSDEVNDLPGVSELKKLDSGTLVIWENFDRIHNETKDFNKNFSDKIAIAKRHMSLVFHRYLNSIGSDRIRIFFNNDELIGMDPFLTGNPATQPLKQQSLIINGETIKVKPFVLPLITKIKKKELESMGGKEELRQKQGFYVYRNKRLIIWGTWFRLIKQEELGKLARVQVDIPNTLDSLWDIDIKKSKASLPYMVKKNLTDIVKNAVGSSARVYRYRGRNVQMDKMVHLWNPIETRDTFQYRINHDFPLFKELEEAIPEEKQGVLNSFIRILEATLPYYDIYCRMSENNHAESEKEMTDEDIFVVAQEMIENLKAINMDISTFLQGIELIEPFNKRPDVVKRIREVYGK